MSNLIGSKHRICKNCDYYLLNKDCPYPCGNNYQCFSLIEHDKQIRAEVLREVESAMYHQCFECDNDEDMQKWDGGNWIRYKLFENVIERVKEKKNE